MKYYQVSLDVEVTGVKDGLYQIEIDKVQMSENNAFQDFLIFFKYANTDFWNKQSKIQSFEIPTINAKLLKNAKVTDIMGYTPSITFLNYAYSDKFINILKAFDIGNFTTFEVRIENVLEKYHMLFIQTILLTEIDYSKSQVYTGHKVRNNIEYFNFDNYEEYWNFKKDNPLSKFEKLSISKEHLGKDIIEVQASPLSFYSEKLIDFLFDCGITGLHVNYSNSIELNFS